MTRTTVVLVGGPDSGKTNYLARLWEALRSGGGALAAPQAPNDIKYVEDSLAHLLQGEFAPRSDTNVEDSRRNFAVPVVVAGVVDAPTADIIVPDVSGELWRAAVESFEIAPEWMDELKQASGALLFVRVRSDLNRAPLDWVNAGKLMRSPLLKPEEGVDPYGGLPTQVMLCELLRFLNHTLKSGALGARPRVAVVITAWDMMDKESAARGPGQFLKAEYPLFSGRLSDIETLEVRVFGVSVVGGDLIDPKFRETFFEQGLKTAGYVVTDNDAGVLESSDLTLPVAWVIEGLVTP